MARDVARNRLYVTDITAAEGAGAIYTVDARTNQITGKAVAAAAGVAHNLAFSARTQKLYLGHSGANSKKVSVYRVNDFEINPVLEGVLETTGANPFGLGGVN